jgi:hypothetical protein
MRFGRRCPTANPDQIGEMRLGHDPIAAMLELEKSAGSDIRVGIGSTVKEFAIIVPVPPPEID